MKKIKGFKKAVSLMKKHTFVRVYLNTHTGNLIAIEYADCNSWTEFESKNISEVYTYNAYKEEVPTMRNLEQEIKERLAELAFILESNLSINN